MIVVMIIDINIQMTNISINETDRIICGLGRALAPSGESLLILLLGGLFTVTITVTTSVTIAITITITAPANLRTALRFWMSEGSTQADS